jgi:hypothetical protein
MTEKIQQIIDAIKQKTLRMHSQLVATREQNVHLGTENQSLKERIESLEQTNEVLKAKLFDLELQLTATKEQVVHSSFSNSRKEEEIDELVKEIEYCISQLKK